MLGRLEIFVHNIKPNLEQILIFWTTYGKADFSILESSDFWILGGFGWDRLPFGNGWI